MLTADTHLPRRAKALPGPLLEAVDAADVVVHAGDWVDEDTLDLLEERSARLVACWGNNDGPGLRARLPEVARADVGGVRLGVVHETGAKQRREERMDATYGGSAEGGLDVLVFGHSHIPWDTVTPGGTRLLNPGSPTDRRREPWCTFQTARVVDGRLEGVELHRLPRR